MGRPKGSKNKPKVTQQGDQPLVVALEKKLRQGRPEGSKNRPKEPTPAAIEDVGPEPKAFVPRDNGNEDQHQRKGRTVPPMRKEAGVQKAFLCPGVNCGKTFMHVFTPHITVKGKPYYIIPHAETVPVVCTHCGIENTFVVKTRFVLGESL